MSENRRYSEKELIEIFKLAMNRQDKKSETAEPTFSLDEIKKLGEEAGIQPEFLQQAIARVNHQPIEEHDSFLSIIKAEHWIPRRLDETQIENMLAELKIRFNKSSWYGKNELKKLGDTYEYNLGDITTNITLKEDGTLVQFSKSQMFSGTPLEHWVLSFILTLVPGLVPIGLAGEFLGNLWAFAVAVPVFILAFFGLKSYIPKQRKKERDKLEAVANHALRFLGEYDSPKKDEARTSQPEINLEEIEPEADLQAKKRTKTRN